VFACQIGVAGFGRDGGALSSFGIHSRAKKITLFISHPQLESHALKGKKKVAAGLLNTLKSSGLEC
jgi:hypothetical protein